jgi:RNA polymerase sigma-70 factor (ECF subfamily)
VDPKPFTAVDRDLLKRCLNRDPRSWNDFVDRFLSLIYHVIGYTAHLRSIRLSPEEQEDIAAEVLLKIVSNDFKVLREFRGDASLATYLTVISRRICVQELIRRQKAKHAQARGDLLVPAENLDDEPAAQKGVESLEEVEKLLRRLSGKERDIVQLYYFEGRTYEEISTETNIPVNTIGAVLSRARKKLRSSVSKSGVDSLSLAAKSSPSASSHSTKSASTKAASPPEHTIKPVKPSKPAKPPKEKKEGE